MNGETLSSGPRQRALCVLGVHRSGTSAITRAFNLLGAFVGEEADLMPAAPSNPLGFWERNDIYLFHERLLAAVLRRWDTTLLLPDGWQRSPVIAPFREELKNLVQAAFAGRPLWVWKDPRTCILLELWKEVLNELETDLAAVFILRNPCDVAASLSTRNSFGLRKAWGIWLSQTLAALRSTEGVRTTYLRYDKFLEDPVREAHRCFEALGIFRSDRADSASEAISSFVRKDLCHNRASACDLEALPAPAREVFGLISRAIDNPASCDSLFYGRLRELHRRYSEYEEFFREDLEQCLVVAGELEKLAARHRETYAQALAAVERTAAAEQKTAEAAQRAAEAEQKAAEAVRGAVDAEQRAAEAARRAAAAEQRADEAGQRAAEAQQQAEEAEQRALSSEERARVLDRQRTEAEAAFEEIVTSRIWRMSGPVRKVADLVRRRFFP